VSVHKVNKKKICPRITLISRKKN